jgi:hypothetical protein
MPDSLISKPPACVASLRYCPPSPDQLSAITGIRNSQIYDGIAQNVDYGITGLGKRVRLKWG